MSDFVGNGLFASTNTSYMSFMIDCGVRGSQQLTRSKLTLRSSALSSTTSIQSQEIASLSMWHSLRCQYDELDESAGKPLYTATASDCCRSVCSLFRVRLGLWGFFPDENLFLWPERPPHRTRMQPKSTLMFPFKANPPVASSCNCSLPLPPRLVKTSRPLYRRKGPR